MNHEKITTEDFIKLLQDDSTEVIEMKELTNFTTAKYTPFTIPKNKNLTIRHCFFKGKTEFKNVKFWENLIFEDCTFGEIDCKEESIFHNIYYSDKGNLEFTSSNIFNQNFNFKNIRTNRFEFSSKSVKKLCFSQISNLIINGKNVMNDLVFSDCQDTNSILMMHTEIRGLLSFDSSIGKSLTIISGKYSKILFRYIFDIDSLKIIGSKDNLNSLHINELNFSSLNLKGKMELKYCQIDKLVMPNFDGRDGQFSMQGVTISESLQMDDSNLSGSFFSDLNLFKAKLIFDRSNLNNSTFSNVTWPKKHEIQTLKSSKTVNTLTVKTEVYRQLKKLCKDNSNTFDALKFYRQEMNTYWQRVKIDKSEKRWNRFLIRVDRFVSDFGQSYMRPIVIMMVFHLILCASIWTREAYYHHYMPEWDIKDFENGFGQYFNWLLPVFKTPEKWTSASIGISFFMRILNGFFIYHFIRATRKFSKL